MYHVDLNSDLGESFGAYTIGLDKEVIAQISSANVACGYHAGDPLVMAETARLCREASVAFGAHPGFPDLMGFGRRNMACSPKEVKAYMSYQLGALYAFAKAAGLTLQHVKPHGALYNMAAKDAALARAIAEAVAEFDDKLILLGLANSFLISEAEAVGLCGPRLPGGRLSGAALQRGRRDSRQAARNCPHRSHGEGGQGDGDYRRGCPAPRGFDLRSRRQSLGRRICP